MIKLNPSCAVAFTRERNNATDTKQATGNATTMAQNASKPTSLQELRAQLRAQLARNSECNHEAEKQAELRSLILTCGKYYGFSAADFDEAIQIGIADLDSALTCYRSIAAKNHALPIPPTANANTQAKILNERK